MPIIDDPYADLTDEQLGKRVKAKYVGAYDDMADAAIGKAMRVKATPQLGDVSKQARKNLAKVEAEKTSAEYGQDVRDVWAQGVREVATPIAAGAVGLATGGLGLIPAALAAGGTAAAGETIVQMGNPTENVARDIALTGAIGGLSEVGGRLIGASIAKVVAKRAAARAATAPEYADIAKRLGFPEKNVESKVGSSLQARVDNMRRALVTKEADEIMAPYGSPVTAELAGQEAGGVLKSVEEKFVRHARDVRQFISNQIGDAPAPLRETIFKAAELKHELGKRAFKGMEELDGFFNAMVDENGAFKKFTVDELLALRSDVGRELGRVPAKNPKHAFLKRLYGAMSDDAEKIIASRDPQLADAFKQANADFSEYFGALKNEVASRLMNEANAGNGTAVVRELFKAAPSDIDHVFRFVQSTRPQEMGKFRKTIQQAALQNIFGVADDGAPVMGYKLAERLEKMGADRLDTIFSGSAEAAAALGRVKELAKLTGSFERSLKIPPDLSRQMDSGIKRLIMQAGIAIGAKAWGAPYAAARMGAEALRGAGDLVMAELAVRPELFRQFKTGWTQMSNAVSNTTLGAATRKAMTASGEGTIKKALAAASNAAALEVRAQAERKQVEAGRDARRYAGVPQGFSPQVGPNSM